MPGDAQFYDMSPLDTPSMMMLDTKPTGIATGIVRGVDTESGKVNVTLTNYGGGQLDDIPLMFPAAGAGWGFAVIPDEGDIVEIQWTFDGLPYARPTIPFRYWDWIAADGNKRLRPGEFFMRSKGDALLYLARSGTAVLEDSGGSKVHLDPVQETGGLTGRGAAFMLGGNGTRVQVGSIRRQVTNTVSGTVGVEYIDTPDVPGVLPPNEHHMRVVPQQPSLFTDQPPSLIDQRIGDVYDDDGNRVTESAVVFATDRRIETLIGATYREETYFNSGKYEKNHGFATLLKMTETYDPDPTSPSLTWKMQAAELTQFDILKLIYDISDPLITTALAGGVRRLVDERMVDLFNDFVTAFNLHTHVVSGTAAAPTVPGFLNSASTGEQPAVPVVSTPVTTVVTKAQ